MWEDSTVLTQHKTFKTFLETSFFRAENLYFLKNFEQFYSSVCILTIYSQ